MMSILLGRGTGFKRKKEKRKHRADLSCDQPAPLCHWQGERPNKEKVSLLCVLTWSSRTEEGRKGLNVQELSKPCMTFPLHGGQVLVSYMHSYLCIQLQCGLVGSLGGKDMVVAMSGRVSLKSSV